MQRESNNKINTFKSEHTNEMEIKTEIPIYVTVL